MRFFRAEVIPAKKLKDLGEQFEKEEDRLFGRVIASKRLCIIRLEG